MDNYEDVKNYYRYVKKIRKQLTAKLNNKSLFTIAALSAIKTARIKKECEEEYKAIVDVFKKANENQA